MDTAILGLVAAAGGALWLWVRNQTASMTAQIAQHQQESQRVTGRLETKLDKCEKDRDELWLRDAAQTQVALNVINCPQPNCVVRQMSNAQHIKEVLETPRGQLERAPAPTVTPA